jgi:hypothetical protein
MTGLSGRSPTWDIVSPIKRSAMFCRHGIAPAPERKRTTTWAEFIRTHLVLLAGMDFFTVEVLTLRGLVTYYSADAEREQGAPASPLCAEPR